MRCPLYARSHANEVGRHRERANLEPANGHTHGFASSGKSFEQCCQITIHVASSCCSARARSASGSGKPASDGKALRVLISHPLRTIGEPVIYRRTLDGMVDCGAREFGMQHHSRGCELPLDLQPSSQAAITTAHTTAVTSVVAAALVDQFVVIGNSDDMAGFATGTLAVLEHGGHFRR